MVKQIVSKGWFVLATYTGYAHAYAQVKTSRNLLVLSFKLVVY